MGTHTHRSCESENAMVVAVCACHRRQHHMNDKNVWYEINLKQMQNNKCSLIFINFLLRQSDLVVLHAVMCSGVIESGIHRDERH